jgi:alkanesulfonate monooxygenase SsuD/methylene tetrahydromethanopterin reductase-like flavin-dependent oxidoreductase (luciferase family)
MISVILKQLSIWRSCTRKLFSLRPDLGNFFGDLTSCRFWEGSWEDGAQIWSNEHGAYDPRKVHKITFNGEYHKTAAFNQAHPSPQRTPVIFQAGSSPAGKAFAAKHAEAIFCGGAKPTDISDMIKEMRAMAVKEGRDPYDLKFFPVFVPFLGHTLEEAQAKYDQAYEYADWEAGLAVLSDFTGLDLSKFPLDEPIKFGDDTGAEMIQTMVNALRKVATEGTTLRKLGKDFAFCGFGCKPVGTAEMIADVIEEWIEVADIDGFNIACKLRPQFLVETF